MRIDAAINAYDLTTRTQPTTETPRVLTVQRNTSTTGGDQSFVQLSDEAQQRLDEKEASRQSLFSNEQEDEAQQNVTEALQSRSEDQDAERDSNDVEGTDSRPPQTDATGRQLTEAEIAQVKEMERRDTEVRIHEQAHMTAAGGHARGGPQYEYETGPDGKRYVVGGFVRLDTSPVAGDPQATLEKATTIKRAALAPAQPSSADRAIAAQADRMAAEARGEIAEDLRAEAEQRAQPADEEAGPTNVFANDADDAEAASRSANQPLFVAAGRATAAYGRHL